MKSDKYPVNVGYTKSHDRENSNRRLFTKDSNFHSLDMKDTTQNKCKQFSIETRVTLFGLKKSGIQQKRWCHLIPTRTISPELCYPLLNPPFNSPDTLFIEKMIVVLYTIILVFFNYFVIFM